MDNCLYKNNAGEWTSFPMVQNRAVKPIFSIQGLKTTRPTNSKLSPNELQEKFGEYKLTVTDAEGDSAKLISHKTSEFGRYAEVTLESFQNYIRFCDHNGVDGERRFNKFHSFLQGTARDEWVRLTDHGHEHWDGVDTSTNAQFRKALEAWTIMMTECRDPGNLQQQKLMGIAYKTFKQEGYLIKPTTFYKRWNHLWELSEFFPRVGAPLTELQKLDAMIMGVPQDWMEWLEKNKGVDVRDNANGGQNPISCKDLFKWLDIRWTDKVLKEIRKAATKQSNSNRKRDEDYENSDTSKGGRKRHHGNNDDGRDDDEEKSADEEDYEASDYDGNEEDYEASDYDDDENNYDSRDNEESSTAGGSDDDDNSYSGDQDDNDDNSNSNENDDE